MTHRGQAGSRRPGRIVSGGQTGVDRAALDFAIAHDIPYAGWCPRGGWAEDHPVPPGLLGAYPRLRETPSADPEQRTRWNVRDSDATLIVAFGGGGRVSPGTATTETAAAELERPLLRLDASDLDRDSARAAIERLLSALGPSPALNVAGPRQSEQPQAYDAALRLLGLLLG
ncbi:MAG TPA: putative molybdenum carrier protein [Solirubrobacteraceae bacterium]|nr:putative molybdenum carrier protein [Solirubrobacteraceae bacterium]